MAGARSMIGIRLTNNHAIDLHALLNSLDWLSNPDTPNDARSAMLASFAANEGLGAIAVVLKQELDIKKRSQELKAGFMEGDRND
jgi:hypothetical protein